MLAATPVKKAASVKRRVFDSAMTEKATVTTARIKTNAEALSITRTKNFKIPSLLIKPIQNKIVELKK